jgi:hypothetical protein
MPLRDPVAVYNAANNTQAMVVRDALAAAGVEAFVTEDLSVVGTWIGGFIPEIHKPQVWVDRADVERAAPVLVEYERRAAELRRGAAADGGQVEVACEKCNGVATFPAAQQGTVQECPHCGAYIDVGEDGGWGEVDEEQPGEAEDGS